MFRGEFFGKLLNEALINFVFTELLHNLVHGHEQLRPLCDFIDDFMFHPDVVAFVLSEKRTISAYSYTILNADNL